MPTINFSVEGESINATKLEAKARQFKFIVDEPPALGGKDEGANPVEYLLGSYAGCLNVVFHLVAKEEGITINSLGIKVNGDIDPARLFGSSTFNRAGFQSINVEFDIDSDADEATINQLISKVKSRCPINDNLSNVTQLNYSVVSSAVPA
ncbi:OsmC family protein [Aridibaculum aurantiacum]|uniref:OsmC family protein n=1 Tax=Aridibaculum aurantiacum TaxID=2810307 RepID=UPI001A96EF48|nr:OsmC family protein [Aridibaculum aurantiacum]